ncbi:hypothetical protein NMY22_g20132 [Coprinellus aureogranulatus]|nr:hypothetical protein NMY22_g20132 [Coprinellus aureogranulatus]
MASFSMNDTRVRSLPLSYSMRGLLGSLLRVIDQRIADHGEARLWADAVEDPKLVPSTCDTCCGTGFILADAPVVPSAPKAVVGGSMDPVPGYPPSPAEPASTEIFWNFFCLHSVQPH